MANQDRINRSLARAANDTPRNSHNHLSSILRVHMGKSTTNMTLNATMPTGRVRMCLSTSCKPR